MAGRRGGRPLAGEEAPSVEGSGTGGTPGRESFAWYRRQRAAQLVTLLGSSEHTPAGGARGGD
jgi:hypothetical protein